jgi:hypothetical protein
VTHHRCDEYDLRFYILVKATVGPDKLIYVNALPLAQTQSGVHWSLEEEKNRTGV